MLCYLWSFSPRLSEHSVFYFKHLFEWTQRRERDQVCSRFSAQLGKILWAAAQYLSYQLLILHLMEPDIGPGSRTLDLAGSNYKFGHSTCHLNCNGKCPPYYLVFISLHNFKFIFREKFHIMYT